MRLLIVVFIYICGANEIQVLMSNRWKMNDVEYGERLSTRDLLNKKSGRHIVTKCTTNQPITTDPNYIPNSEEDDNAAAKKLTAEDEDPAIEDGEPKKVYKPPSTGNSPDHYIDDD
ncbi:PREDICTED: uncharacterized protein LOC106125846 isoform X2 [Papilio xuthus]|uniref:Uncharacterized protein LOC106125846 isoform X2 n=1 Tax=Papilio xuthus TaxID=66420 RepID=A0AAJ6ZT51_PAPXU|nr:PREDICTED: uncharacterized protein LOC106125846 isoform X2 [Papilio xuthus]